MKTWIKTRYGDKGQIIPWGTVVTPHFGGLPKGGKQIAFFLILTRHVVPEAGKQELKEPEDKSSCLSL